MKNLQFHQWPQIVWASNSPGMYAQLDGKDVVQADSRYISLGNRLTGEIEESIFMDSLTASNADVLPWQKLRVFDWSGKELGV